MFEDRSDREHVSGDPGPERTEEPEVGTLAWGWDQLKRSVRHECCCSSMLVLAFVATFGLVLVAVSAGRAWHGMR